MQLLRFWFTKIGIKLRQQQKYAKTAVTALNAAGVDTKKLGSTVKSIAKTASSAFGTIGKGAGKIISGLRPVATFLSGAFKKHLLSFYHL